MVHASLFSGIGGPEVAAAMLGWDNAFHCEINPFGRKILEYWFPNSTSYEDITKTDFSKWRGKIDVISGGFPCQPFSYSGKRRGASDDRYLWPQMLRVINEVRPAWVIGENVAGITTMVEQCEELGMEMQADFSGEIRREMYKYKFTIERVCRDLEKAGYSVLPVLIPACAVGAPHRRDRVFIVGHLTDTNGARQSASDKPSGRTLQTMDGERSCQSFDGTERPCTLRPIADTIPEDSMHSGFVHGQYEVEGHQRNEWDISAGGSERLRGIVSRFEAAEAIAGNGRWQHFPTVSPVHRGNDGLPFNVDDLTIPFSKWRTESLKAYGNAIMPQVIYEIFRAIEEVERY